MVKTWLKVPLDWIPLSQSSTTVELTVCVLLKVQVTVSPGWTVMSLEVKAKLSTLTLKTAARPEAASRVKANKRMLRTDFNAAEPPRAPGPDPGHADVV